MPLPNHSPIIRLRIHPEQPKHGPPAIDHHRPRDNGKASRRPHNDLTVQAVKHLIERTALTYSQISAKTGVGRASISRWSRDFKWLRPLDAPISTDRMPTQRALRKKKLRLLAGRFLALAEDMIAKLEASPDADIEGLMGALQVLKMARLEDQGRRRRRRDPDIEYTGASLIARDDAIRKALKDMHRGGVTIDRTPQKAIDLLLDAYAPEERNVGYTRPVRPRGKWVR